MVRVIRVNSNDATTVAKRIHELLEDPRDLMTKAGAVISAEA